MNQANQIDLKEYLNLLKRWWWVPATLSLLFAIFSAIYCFYIATKIYEANTSLYVISKEMQDNSKLVYSDLQSGGLLIKDFKELIKQRAVSLEVIEELKLGKSYPVNELINNINVINKNDTRILQISVKDKDPQRAAVLADKIVEVFTRKVIQTMNVENVKIIDKAEIPTVPSSPKTMQTILIAIFLGTALGFGIVLLINYFDNTIKTTDDVKKILKLKILTTLPVLGDSSKKDVPLDSYEIISSNEPKSTVAEQFRILRTSLLFKAADNELKKILITSSNPSEGKSTTLVNLAVVLAQSGSKVLIIDADLRKSVVHKYFKLSQLKGLTAFLPKKDDTKKYIQKTKINNVDAVFSGPVPPDPSEILGSKLMKEFLDKVSADYDYVLIDTPPVGVVTDAAVLSKLCDGVILVVASGKTEIDSAVEATEELNKVDANILGVVLNRVKRRKEEYYYYYGQSSSEGSVK